MFNNNAAIALLLNAYFVYYLMVFFYFFNIRRYKFIGWTYKAFGTLYGAFIQCTISTAATATSPAH